MLSVCASCPDIKINDSFLCKPVWWSQCSTCVTSFEGTAFPKNIGGTANNGECGRFGIALCPFSFMAILVVAVLDVHLYCLLRCSKTARNITVSMNGFITSMIPLHRVQIW